jgi:hypothetical protein
MSERQWRPTKEYFEQDERAKQLRNLCISAIEASEAGISGEKDDEILGSTLDINAQLQALGIERGMHTIDRSDAQAEEKRDALMSDAVRTAEWVAGQVLSALESGAVSKGISPEDFEEHDEFQGQGAFPFVDTRAMSPRMREFVVDYTLIGTLQGFVDYEAGPSEV